MLRWLCLLFMIPTLAAAKGFDFVPGDQGHQSFRESLVQGNFKKALSQWPVDLAQTPNGRALFAYLLLQNGYPYLGLTTVISLTAPKELNPELRQMWHHELSESQLVQKNYILLSHGWDRELDTVPVLPVLRTPIDSLKVLSRADRFAKENINGQARLWWAVATQAPQFNDLNSALIALKRLQESGQTVIGRDLVQMTLARVLYQKGDLAAAEKAYQEVPKSSDLWLVVLEERAWLELRRNDMDKALGDLVTLTSPVLAPLVGPETFYLSNLLSLKACDYARIFKITDIFKERSRQRLKDLEQLESRGASEHSEEALARMRDKGVHLESLGALVNSVPRASWRDRRLVRDLALERQIQAELSHSQDLQKIPSNPFVVPVMNHGKQEITQLEQNVHDRLRSLARVELMEYKRIIHRMQIIEAEVIERMNLDNSLHNARPELAKNKDSGDVLVFPYTSDEVWFDELDNYKARVKDCPSRTLKGASL